MSELRRYRVTQTYWENTEKEVSEEDTVYYHNTVEVEAESGDTAIQKACLEGLFDECGYEVEDYTISDVYDVEEV